MPKAKSKTKKSSRKKIPSRTVEELLSNCHRVCALCWALERDGRAKEGQIAHIDRKNKHNALSNLCFLCLFHHNRYDTMMNQSKNFSQGELIQYKRDVENLVKEAKLPTSDNGFRSALLSVEIIKAILYGLGPGEIPGLELRVICSNQGTLATGLKSVFLSNDAALHGTLICQKGPPTVWAHPDSEVFYLGSSQILSPGRANRWVMRFNLSEKSSGCLASLRNRSEAEKWKVVELEPPIAVTIEPVLGTPVLCGINKVTVTQRSLNDASFQEHLEIKAEAETQELVVQEHRKDSEIDKALRWPFPTRKGCLRTAILYQSRNL